MYILKRSHTVPSDGARFHKISSEFRRFHEIFMRFPLFFPVGFSTSFVCRASWSRSAKAWDKVATS